MASSSPDSSKLFAAAIQMAPRLQKCWDLDLDWDLFPPGLREACYQAGKALSMPPTAVLAGLIFVVSFSMSHSVVHVEGTDWNEPVLVWLSICMPTGCGKSSLCKYLHQLVSEAQLQCRQDGESSWVLDDQSFEKLGEMMQKNHGKLLGLYDELPMFLSQLNICRGRALADSQQVSIFLQLYGADRWIRRTVSGEANFTMNYTGLSVGGFTQPSVARNLLEYGPNVEKGLCQRFLWLLPKPRQTAFDELESVNPNFTASIVTLMVSQWKPNNEVTQWNIKRPCKVFSEKYDALTDVVSKISSMDDLLAGMLSKSKGQILRVSAVLEVLFHWENPHNIPSDISDNVLKAAINFVDVCTQHAAFLAGRNQIEDAVESIQKALSNAKHDDLKPTCDGHASAALSLTLPGQVLNLSALIYLKKFRYNGNKQGALRGWELLETAGLGTIEKLKASRGTDKLFEFHKQKIPDDITQKEAMATTLMQFKVSLQQYSTAFSLDNITMRTIAATRSSRLTSPTRKSPRIKSMSADRTQMQSPSARKELNF